MHTGIVVPGRQPAQANADHEEQEEDEFSHLATEAEPSSHARHFKFFPYAWTDVSANQPSPPPPAQGLGLGLSIALHFFEQHGGTIAVESAGLHAGTTFHVTLPLNVSPADGAA
ncbi:MAG: hypothetical protein DI587_03390 [Variovorax paradoxus]|nr:MAG: hypothetical protein DI583_03390 [Variovorax paradoxus]PZQ15318.1 MAG: hypothetical protein DI587_03390 [Variovorax paradoxus]